MRANDATPLGTESFPQSMLLKVKAVSGIVSFGESWQSIEIKCLSAIASNGLGEKRGLNFEG